MKGPGGHIAALPSHIQKQLADAFDTGMLYRVPSPMALRSVLGPSHGTQALADDLRDLAAIGVSGRGVAACVRILSSTTGRSPGLDLVWSGPEVVGLHSRNTRRVYEELAGSARRSVWMSTYVYFDGPRAFAELARRMDEVSDLRVTLLLNIQRSRGDTTTVDALVSRFADRFWGTDWPGDVRPAVFYDPRSLELAGPSGVLHAKAVVVDDETVFITSANLTAAAQDRNIELGILTRNYALAISIRTHFQTLIDQEFLAPLPSR